MKKSIFFLLLAGICVFGFVLRLYRITEPVADWHSFRQVDTASVARNFVKNGIDIVRPRYDDLSNIQSGKDNPMGWRMVEFPVYQVLSVFVYKLIPGITIEIALRSVSIIAAVGTIALLGVIGRKISGEWVGLASALFYAMLPYSVFYGRTILPESLMVFLSVASVACMLWSVDTKNRVFQFALQCLCAGFAALSLLTKPYAIFFLLPAGLLYLKTFRFNSIYVLSTLFYLFVAFGPLYWWRQWILQFPEGIPVYTWLFNEGNIRFKGAWFYWLFAERIAKLIFGYWGVLFVSLGVASTWKRHEWLVYPILLAGSLLYIVIIARGNVQHDYYQILLLPTLAFLAGKGAIVFLSGSGKISRFRAAIGTVIVVLFMLGFSWYEIRGFYWINRPEIVEAGKEADALLPTDAKVIAPYNGDTTFLYQTNRSGWPIGFEIEKKIAMGATHYVTVSPTDADGETKDLASRYTVLVRNDRFAIIDLTKPNTVNELIRK